jgi:hypothetical protein
MVERLSARAARRVVLAAGGFGGGREGATGRHLRKLAVRLGALQIDSVNVLARAHLMPGFSRLGAYEIGDFEAAAWGGKRAWFEYWGHEACFLPLEMWPLMQWRMRQPGKWIGSQAARFGAERPEFVQRVRAELRDRGALAAADLSEAGAAKGAWWGWSDGKMAMEHLFWTGEVTVSHRRGAFERVYDFAERVIPAGVHAAPIPDEAEAHRALMRIAAAAMGVMTESDLRAYWRLKPAATARVAELVEEGSLIPVDIEGWDRPALLWHQAKIPRRLDAACLVSPFDPLLWERDRALRVFGFHYRIGLYTPKEQRTEGYYVLPFFLGDRVAARVDLKADRKARVLRVEAAHLEAGSDAEATGAALARELGRLTGWLGLATTDVTARGDLAAPLAAAIRAAN